MTQLQLNAAPDAATYLQLVERVHDARRPGLLGPGERLPAAQQVAARLADIPDTALKAYRCPEREAGPMALTRFAAPRRGSRFAKGVA